MDLPHFKILERMAKEDPEALEQLRLAHVEAIIADAGLSNERRLRGLQFQIDAIRRGSSNPMAACIRISKLMHDSLIQLNTVLQSEVTPPTAALSQCAPAGMPVTAEQVGCQVYQFENFRAARA
ncbi:DUF3135 domain-containing protein [Allohahella marinimesophila]|uniref:DUF3135 domain-containing protein n=1 Tax=Allohahella marinimesophila TaxID=1054972 RepID=A0ABP7Q681_9GAMM